MNIQKLDMVVDTETGITFQDEGVWRSYHLYSEGETLLELIDNAYIAEIDQDGGELTNYSIDNMNKDDHSLCFKLLEDAFIAAIEQRFLARKDSL